MSLLVAGVAAAWAASARWGVDGARNVELSGPVEVTLYRGPGTDQLPAVWVDLPVGEGADPNGMLAVVDLCSGWTRVNEATARANGWKVRQAHHPPGFRTRPFRPVVAVPSFRYARIAELHIGDVVLHGVRAEVADGPALVLGAGTLEELVTEIVPSRGVVRFTPSGGAVEGGEPVRRVAARRWSEHGAPAWGNGLTCGVAGEIAGVVGPVRLETASVRSTVAAEGPEPLRVGNARLGSAETSSGWVWRTDEIADPSEHVAGTVGADLAWSLDLGFDPTHDTMTVAAAGASNEADPADRDRDGATRAARLEALEKAAADAPDACAAQRAYGLALAEEGRYDDAVAPLQRAGDLWDAWTTRPLQERMRERRRAARRGGEAGQPGSCHLAWGDVAEAELYRGRPDRVAEVFAAHADLDPHLFEVFAAARAGDADPTAAIGSLRNAIERGAGAEARSWLALLDRRSDLDLQVDRILAAPGDVDLAVGARLVEAARLRGGDAAALALARRLAAADPTSVPAALLVALEAPDTERAAAITDVESRLVVARRRRLHDPGVIAWEAVLIGLREGGDAGRTALGELPAGSGEVRAATDALATLG